MRESKDGRTTRSKKTPYNDAALFDGIEPLAQTKNMPV